MAIYQVCKDSCEGQAPWMIQVGLLAIGMAIEIWDK